MATVEQKVAQLNAEVVEAIRGREQPKASYGYGIVTADRYVRGVMDVMTPGQLGEEPSVFLKEAEATLTYANEDTLVDGEKLMTSMGAIDEYCKELRVDTPAHTLMVFENVITTPSKDRDNDILRTEGADPDPRMPLLWHHMLPMPMGKMLKVLVHNSKRLKVATALIDSELGHDGAVLIEFGALRISHGFRPLKMERLERKPGSDDGGPMGVGFDIKEFEIMEESLVTVPSNTDTVITAFSRGKLCDPTVKSWAKHKFDERPTQVAGITLGDQDAMVALQKVVHDMAVKEGRVLSSKNENRLAEAHKMIGEVLEQVKKKPEEGPTIDIVSFEDTNRKFASKLFDVTGSDLESLKSTRALMDIAIESLEREPEGEPEGLDSLFGI